ncbi:uncharacterized protein (DUF488 family) [Paenibacillus baekrokdamisoli]|nr:uncharacterized protein (DUF488 family) [Paenibacillus baekrokdamisoli]
MEVDSLWLKMFYAKSILVNIGLLATTAMHRRFTLSVTAGSKLITPKKQIAKHLNRKFNARVIKSRPLREGGF